MTRLAVAARLMSTQSEECMTPNHQEDVFRQAVRLIRRILAQRHHIWKCLMSPWRNWMDKRRSAESLAKWKQNGCPVPPPHIVKQMVLREYSRRFGIRVLVETGTYRGDMVAAMRPHFHKIYSVELGRDLYESAVLRFRGVRNVEIIHGDSGIEIKRVLDQLSEPALFWLDGHYSAGITARGDADTPIFEELTHLLTSRDIGHVILIDDARCFGTDPTYPSIESLKSFVLAKRPNVEICIEHDSIRITPKRSAVVVKRAPQVERL